MNLDRSSRDEKFHLAVRKTATSELIKKATRRTGYRMPSGYIDTKSLINIDINCEILARMSTDEVILRSLANEDNGQDVENSVAFAKCFNYWARDKGALYCIKKELATALLQTDIVEKKGILKDLPVVLPQFLVAIPESLNETLKVENDRIDFLLISCFLDKNENRTILLGSVTPDVRLLVFTFKITKEGEILNKIDIKNNKCHNKVLLFALNIVLLLGTTKNSLVSNVLPSQTIDKQEGKGFNK